VRLKNTSHVLLSTISAATTSGLPGAILTLADMGQKKLTIVGPAGTENYVSAATAAGFLNRPEQQLATVDVIQGTELQDTPKGIEITSLVVGLEEQPGAAAVVAPAASEDDAIEPPAKRHAIDRAVCQPGQSEPGSTSADGVTTTAATTTTAGRAGPVQLFVGNLPYSVEQEILRAAFDRFGGGATEAKIIKDRQTGTPRGFGFVTMPSSVAAEAAIDAAAMGLVSLDGRALRVGRADRSGNTDAAGTGWTMRGGQRLPGVESPPSSAVSYICQLPTSRGKFNKARYASLPLTPLPLMCSYSSHKSLCGTGHSSWAYVWARILGSLQQDSRSRQPMVLSCSRRTSSERRCWAPACSSLRVQHVQRWSRWPSRTRLQRSMPQHGSRSSRCSWRISRPPVWRVALSI
jgi:hypothetical protein